jgi:hypothetical protein
MTRPLFTLRPELFNATALACFCPDCPLKRHGTVEQDLCQARRQYPVLAD